MSPRIPRIHAHETFPPPRTTAKRYEYWKTEEKDLLLRLVSASREAGNRINWVQIQTAFPNRTVIQCKSLYYQIKNQLKDGISLPETKERAEDCIKPELKEQCLEEDMMRRVNEYFDNLQPMEKLRYVCIFNFYDNDFDFISKNNPGVSVDILLRLQKVAAKWIHGLRASFEAIIRGEIPIDLTNERLQLFKKYSKTLVKILNGEYQDEEAPSFRYYVMTNYPPDFLRKAIDKFEKISLE